MNVVKCDESAEARALKDFLLDINCLDPLTEWTNNFNMFDILKITRTEIRHSNMLSWLLDPNEIHGLGDNILKGFIQYISPSIFDENDLFSILLMDFYSFTLLREWHNIDIVAVSNDEQFVLCIENKIDSSEHDNQLDRYRKVIEETYPDFKKLYIYLSPQGIDASDSENWFSISYHEVLEIIEKTRKQVRLLPEVALLIDNYIDIIRRYIVEDEKLVQICTDIYAKHQKALDLIFENKPDRAAELAKIIKEWADKKTSEGVINVDSDKCTKTYIRFKTPFMSSIIHDSAEPDSGWKTKNHYFYEIKNDDGNQFSIQLVFSSENFTDDQKEICNNIIQWFPRKPFKKNWQWKTCFVTKKSHVDDDLFKDKIFESLDLKLNEIMSFEGKIKSKIKN